MKISKNTLLATVLLLATFSANAMVVRFDLRATRPDNVANNEPTWTFSSSGINLMVEAWSTTNQLATRVSQDIRQNGAGLGVEGDGSTQINTSTTFDTTPASGNTNAEWLSFSTNVGEIVGAGINSLGPGEEADFWGSSAANFNLGDFDFLGTLNGIGAIDIQTMAISLGTQPWLMVASSVPVVSGFRVAWIDVELPEPGTIGLLVIGLLGIAWKRRRNLI